MTIHIHKAPLLLIILGLAAPGRASEAQSPAPQAAHTEEIIATQQSRFDQAFKSLLADVVLEF